jgi:hypothetical protein
MTYRVRITSSALASAEEIYLWLKEQDPLEAVQWFNGLFEASESLAKMPKRCGIAPETELLGVEVRCLYLPKVLQSLVLCRGDHGDYSLHPSHLSRYFNHRRILWLV